MAATQPMSDETASQVNNASEEMTPIAQAELASEVVLPESAPEFESHKGDNEEAEARHPLLPVTSSPALADPLPPPAYDTRWTPGAWSAQGDVKIPLVPPAYRAHEDAESPSEDGGDDFSDVDDDLTEDPSAWARVCSLAVRVFRAFACTALIYMVFLLVVQAGLQVWTLVDPRGAQRFLAGSRHHYHGHGGGDMGYHHHFHGHIPFPQDGADVASGVAMVPAEPPVELVPVHHGEKGQVHQLADGIPAPWGRPRPLPFPVAEPSPLFRPDVLLGQVDSMPTLPMELPHVTFAVIADTDLTVEVRRVPAHGLLEVTERHEQNLMLGPSPEMAYVSGRNSRNQPVHMLRPLLLSLPTASHSASVSHPLDVPLDPLPPVPLDESLHVSTNPALLIAAVRLPIHASAPACPRRFAHEVSKMRASMSRFVEAMQLVGPEGNQAAKWSVEGTRAWWAAGTGEDGHGVEVWLEIVPGESA
ncbi:hypothetical protein M427DRAFT_53722 [Gonapodya prolifera JEL478]|uniref:Uncharacterized protein n=1 Tax=Gonapodya prolifera (strain JEL478) TaxID=1344416 RepID=A0A139AP84_GONPJ|nr:hypothetical protein M427DRAFT_53722 [Gonapodya prolifera JEL478]|eukprot:KXS18323.1 hypothetical protein M427DRAFT_53722 [Gonapodya prolifera JEL478]